MGDTLITDNVTSDNLNPGDEGRYRGKAVTLDAGGNEIFYGGAVTFDGSGNITHTTAGTDDYIGVVLPQSDEKGDSKYTVYVYGDIIAVPLASDASASAGDTLIPSGTDAGMFDGVAGGMTLDSSTGDTAYLNHPFALESGGNDDVILAVHR